MYRLRGQQGKIRKMSKNKDSNVHKQRTHLQDKNWVNLQEQMFPGKRDSIGQLTQA